MQTALSRFWTRFSGSISYISNSSNSSQLLLHNWHLIKYIMYYCLPITGGRRDKFLKGIIMNWNAKKASTKISTLLFVSYASLGEISPFYYLLTSTLKKKKVSLHRTYTLLIQYLNGCKFISWSKSHHLFF